MVGVMESERIGDFRIAQAVLFEEAFRTPDKDLRAVIADRFAAQSTETFAEGIRADTGLTRDGGQPRIRERLQESPRPVQPCLLSVSDWPLLDRKDVCQEMLQLADSLHAGSGRQARVAGHWQDLRNPPRPLGNRGGMQNRALGTNHTPSLPEIEHGAGEEQVDLAPPGIRVGLVAVRHAGKYKKRIAGVEFIPSGGGRLKATASGDDVNQGVGGELPHLFQATIGSQLTPGQDLAERRFSRSAVDDFVPEWSIGRGGS